MRVAFLAPELSRWDGAVAEALVAWVFEDERPVRGAAGLLDWRLCGKVSGWLRSGRFGGRRGEAILFPPGRGLPFRAALILGFGPLGGFEEGTYRTAIREAHLRLRRAGLRRFAVGLPGRASGKIAARRAIELFLDESAQLDTESDVLVIEPPQAQKEMADIVRSRRFPSFPIAPVD
jgi:hypothetical protein